MNGSKTLFSNRAAEAQRKKQDQKGFLNFASWRLGGENCFATVENKTILPQSRRGAKKGNKKGLKLCVFAPWRGKFLQSLLDHGILNGFRQRDRHEIVRRKKVIFPGFINNPQ